MNLIFLTINTNFDISERGIYQDLLRYFKNQGHSIFIAKILGNGSVQELENKNGVIYLNVRTVPVRESKSWKKGVATLLIEKNFTKAIKRHFSHISFDLILYGTPPITYSSTIKYMKKKNPNAISYLLLKDIFPQNAVDLGMFSKKGLLHSYFRRKEKVLYKCSDYIGCMSPANVNYLLMHNDFLSEKIVEVAPNSIELSDIAPLNCEMIRKKHSLPIDVPILIYGGNLGVPQGIPFLIECLEANKNRKDCFFLVVGDGTEYGKLLSWFQQNTPSNAKLIKRLPKEEYDQLVQSCEIGLIFLDCRFTIPNYPSRLLSYLEYSMPIIVASDLNTDIGRIAVENNYGLCCESNDVDSFTQCVDKLVASDELMKSMGALGRRFLEENYLVEHTYNTIIKHLK